MKSSNPFHKIAILAGTCLTALLLSTGAIAQHGGEAVMRGAAAAMRPAAVAFMAAVRRRLSRRLRRGYHGGYGGPIAAARRLSRRLGGWHGGYGWRGGWGCCGWGWGWGGLGLGLYFATLPLYYQTYWWDGVPYYYADNNYYMYDPNAKQYETVAPPPGLQAQRKIRRAAAANSWRIRRTARTPTSRARDKFECHQWAVTQSGYDPTTGSAAPAAINRSDYMRAQAACLEGRGYSVQ